VCPVGTLPASLAEFQGRRRRAGGRRGALGYFRDASAMLVNRPA
jgi:hypothetical protein